MKDSMDNAELRQEGNTLVPVIFLDIDGVLAPFSRSNPAVLCAETCKRLKRLVDELGARVVLVSSWSLDIATEYLADFGVTISDALAEEDRMGGIGRYGFAAREAGIIDYVKANGLTSYVWIDDFGPLVGLEKPNQEHLRWKQREHEWHPLAEHYVETDWFRSGLSNEVSGAGLDDEACQRVRERLAFREDLAVRLMCHSGKP